MEKEGAVIDFERSKTSFTDIKRVPVSRDILHAERTALTVFSAVKEGDSPQPSRQHATCNFEKRTAKEHHETPATQCNTWLVRDTEYIIVEPRFLKLS
jgi:hypothetical protein